MSQITSPASALGSIPNGSYLTWLTSAGASHDLIRLTTANDVVINTTSGRRISLFYAGSEGWRFNSGEALATTSFAIGPNTSDGGDNATCTFAGGGGGSTTTQSRGGRIIAYGNEATNTGSILYIAGNVAGGLHQFYTANAVECLRIRNDGLLDFRATMGNSTKTVGTDAPIDWLQVHIAGTVGYVPVYAA